MDRITITISKDSHFKLTKMGHLLEERTFDKIIQAWYAKTYQQLQQTKKES